MEFLTQTPGLANLQPPEQLDINEQRDAAKKQHTAGRRPSEQAASAAGHSVRPPGPHVRPKHHPALPDEKHIRIDLAL